LDSYGNNVLAARAAIPRLLDLFASRGVRCTWATVGFLFFDDKKDLMAHLPDQLPTYTSPSFSPYRRLADIGANEREDPYHYALSLVRRIALVPGQEIGTHTFSHYYCLEDGHTPAAFRADLVAAQRAAARLGITLRSIVFPRNQVSPSCLEISHELGLAAYRGTERAWPYRPCATDAATLAHRAARLADSYVSITGPNCVNPRRDASGMLDIPSTRFLRPVSRRLRQFEGLREKRIRDSMRYAAETGTVCHLWGHVHTFGADIEANFAVLDRLLRHFDDLRHQHGMQSRNMSDLAAP
jgi:peptidoglycan/xylan/chitin deacetylase (PgdA/CDA1 family)